MPIPDHVMLRPSRFERTPADAYFTIDWRCVQHLDRVFPLHGVLYKEPCAGMGHLMLALDEVGAICEAASDLHWYENADARIRGGVDVWLQPPKGPGHIITNPPYQNALEVVAHLLHNAPAAWLIVLLRASQAHVRLMRDLMKWHRFYGIAPLPFRPKWFEKGPASPRHDFSWFIWRPVHFAKDPPLVLL